MKRRRLWFLPANPDVMGMLTEQSGLTAEAARELAAWTRGEPADGPRLKALEHEADRRKRTLRKALSEAFTTPLDAEDIFELSRGLDEIVNGAKNLVGEATAMSTEPDEAMATMAGQLAAGVARLDQALRAFAAGRRDAATEIADRAVKDQRRLQHTYRRAMSALVENEDLREVTARRELYRRLARLADELTRVAERIWYSVLKED
ncbi:MAG TPA: DUF47 family protein [Solirubrobacterales bacterium]|nr:DUF47 family protein [Solirubrobacterales bacterium]